MQAPTTIPTTRDDVTTSTTAAPPPPSVADPSKLVLLDTDGRHVFFDTIVFDVDDWEAVRV